MHFFKEGFRNITKPTDTKPSQTVQTQYDICMAYAQTLLKTYIHTQRDIPTFVIDKHLCQTCAAHVHHLLQDELTINRLVAETLSSV